MYEQFIGFFDLLKKCSEFQVYNASENQEVMGSLVEKIKIIGVTEDYLDNFEKVFWVIIESDKYNIEDILRKKIGNIYSTMDNIVFFEVNEKQTFLYVFDCYKTRAKNKRKTLAIYQAELNDAVKNEEFEKAAKIREIINKKLNKRNNLKKK
jgi:hypothetical protein